MPADDPIDDRDPPAPRARRSQSGDNVPRTPYRDPDDRHDDEDDDRWRTDYRHYDEDGYEITSNDQMWAVFAHVGVFVVNILAPLIIFFAYGDKSAFVKRHARESLNHQISLILYIFLWMAVAALVGLVVGMAAQSAAAGFITWYVLSMLGVLALSIVNMVLLILATLAASKYQHYRYPMCIRLLG